MMDLYFKIKVIEELVGDVVLGATIIGALIIKTSVKPLALAMGI